MMKNQGGGKLNPVAGVARALYSSWYAPAAVAVTLAAAGGLGYWFREEITSAYTGAQEAVVSTLGVGVALVPIWLAVFLLAVAKRRSWFRRVNLWAGSLVYGAFVLGVLSFFQPNEGALAAFTLDGEVSLGGKVGYAIAGPIAWLGALRVAAVFFVGAAATTPKLSLDLAAALGKLLVFAYVFSIVAIKGTVSGLRHMYRFDPKSRFGQRQGANGRAESPGPTGAPGTQPTTERAHFSMAMTEEVGPRTQAVLSEGAVPAMLTSPAPMAADIDEGEMAAPDPGPDSAYEAEERPLPVAGKYNKFWSEVSQNAEGQNGLERKREIEGDDGDDAGDGPILDAMGTMWNRPSIDLLVVSEEGGISREEMAETAETIRRTLNDYGVEVEIGLVKPGPTVTMYGLIPGWIRRHKQVKVTDEHGVPSLDESGKTVVSRVETKTRVKVDSIMSREKDLALALKTRSIRIDTPVMGESLVGIEVPNPSPSLVTLRGVMESEEFRRMRREASLPIALGKGTGGETVVVDLTKMPHLLIAGATGSGKSVCINTIVSCLIMEKSPAEMRLLLVDPKRVELTPFNGIPHLLTPVVVETDQVVALLKGLIREMLSRYRRMEESAVRNIEAYNGKMAEKMPYLVVAVDELADLMMSASFDVEQSLCRLAQLGRATGIHLIVATQRPSVDVVTGLIKANFPSRLSFGVTSQIDSRTILDSVGAEKLLGRGDMLYLAVDGTRPERVQGVFISDPEIENLVNFWQTTPWAPLPGVSLHAVGDADTDEDSEEMDEGGARDELLDKAIDLAQRYNKMSTSLLQRRLRIGYPRAARLMDQLEEEGVVGPGDGSKSRDVIMSEM
jgi:S-DNA-T family DNA segregation ATPase FtsK/SpoIIIE